MMLGSRRQARDIRRNAAMLALAGRYASSLTLDGDEVEVELARKRADTARGHIGARLASRATIAVV